MSRVDDGDMTLEVQGYDSTYQYVCLPSFEANFTSSTSNLDYAGHRLCMALFYLFECLDCQELFPN